MKCLRCGRTMKDGEIDCECGHFYDDNLHGKRRNIKNNRKKITLIEILFIIIILMVLILYTANFILKNANKHSTVCDTKCEGSSYKINNNKCICSNGEEYPIE